MPKQLMATPEAPGESLETLLSVVPITLFRAVGGGSDDAGWRLVFVSQNVGSLFGYDLDEVMAPGWWLRVVHPDVIENLGEWWNELLGKSPVSREYQVRHSDGSWRWVHDQVRLLRAGDAGFEIVGSWMDVTEQRQAQSAVEEELRNSEERYRDLFENANDVIYTQDLSGTFTSMNRAITRVAGYEPNELIGRSVVEFVDPEGFVSSNANHERKLAGDASSTTYEIDIIARDGSRVPVEVSNRLIYREGVPIGVTGIARDISERRRAEQVRLEGERTVKLLRDVAVASNDFETLEEAFQFALDALCEHLGWPIGHVYALQEGALVSTGVWRAGEGKGFEDFFRVSERDMELGEGVAGQVLGSGRPRWIPDVTSDPAFLRSDAARAAGLHAMLGVPILVGPDPVAMIELFSDRIVQPDEQTMELVEQVGLQLGRAVERIRAEGALSESTRRLRAMFENASDAITLVGDDATFVEINPGAVALTGYAPDELAGRPIAMVCAPEVAAGFEHLWSGFLESGILEGDFAVLRKDGSVAEAELRAVANIVPGLHLAILRDVSDRRLAERDREQTVRDLERAMRERSRLLSRIVKAQEEERQRIAGDIHDDSIQVMTAVGLRLQTFGRQLEGAAHRQLLGRLEETVSLSIARLRQLLFELHPPALHRDGLVAAIRMYVDQMTEEGSPEFSVRDGLAREPVQELRTLIYRIAQEALTNIRKHARASRVTIEITNQGDGTLLLIEDDGVGFHPHSHDDAPLRHLGLVSMTERAESAGGWCRIGSDPGAGTRIDVWVPDSGAGR